MTSATMQTNCLSDPTPTSEILMDTFLHSSARTGDSAREVWLSRQVMLSLVRLVRTEQLLAIRRSVNRLVPSNLLVSPIRGTRGRRGMGGYPGQTQFVFDSDE
jgi:hypothetical protein